MSYATLMTLILEGGLFYELDLWQRTHLKYEFEQNLVFR